MQADVIKYRRWKNTIQTQKSSRKKNKKKI